MWSGGNKLSLGVGIAVGVVVEREGMESTSSKMLEVALTVSKCRSLLHREREPKNLVLFPADSVYPDPPKNNPQTNTIAYSSITSDKRVGSS